MDLNNDSFLQPFEVLISLRIKDVFKFIAQGEQQINLTNMTSNITYYVDSLQKDFGKNFTWILNTFDYKFLHYVILTFMKLSIKFNAEKLNFHEFLFLFSERFKKYRISSII
jgi:hypothetical protein